MQRIAILILFISFNLSCIDPISLENDKEVVVLVVEGGITTEYGPHLIQLTKSAQYGNIFTGEIKGVTGAELFVRDDMGNIAKLTEVGKGWYQTSSDFKGEVGRKYNLIIQTTDGKEYLSYPEEIIVVPEIASIYYEFREVPVIDGVGSSDFISGVDVIVTFQDEESETNYYKWESSGTYRIKTNPELFTVFGPNGPVPAPKDCCDICFLSETGSDISISSDRFYNGNSIDHTITFLKDDGSRFSEKYVMSIVQRSISKETYQFYDLLQNQLNINGDIFDPPPAEIRGNIISINNPEEKVIGHFTASDITRDTIVIWGEDLPKLNDPPHVPDDCQLITGATIVVPGFW